MDIQPLFPYANLVKLKDQNALLKQQLKEQQLQNAQLDQENTELRKARSLLMRNAESSSKLKDCLIAANKKSEELLSINEKLTSENFELNQRQNIATDRGNEVQRLNKFVMELNQENRTLSEQLTSATKEIGQLKDLLANERRVSARLARQVAFVSDEAIETNETNEAYEANESQTATITTYSDHESETESETLSSQRNTEYQFDIIDLEKQHTQKKYSLDFPMLNSVNFDKERFNSSTLDISNIRITHKQIQQTDSKQFTLIPFPNEISFME